MAALNQVRWMDSGNCFIRETIVTSCWHWGFQLSWIRWNNWKVQSMLTMKTVKNDIVPQTAQEITITRDYARKTNSRRPTWNFYSSRSTRFRRQIADLKFAHRLFRAAILFPARFIWALPLHHQPDRVEPRLEKFLPNELQLWFKLSFEVRDDDSTRHVIDVACGASTISSTLEVPSEHRMNTSTKRPLFLLVSGQWVGRRSRRTFKIFSLMASDGKIP